VPERSLEPSIFFKFLGQPLEERGMRLQQILDELIGIDVDLLHGNRK